MGFLAELCTKSLPRLSICRVPWEMLLARRNVS